MKLNEILKPKSEADIFAELDKLSDKERIIQLRWALMLIDKEKVELLMKYGVKVPKDENHLWENYRIVAKV